MVISILFIAQMVLVMVCSKAPFEQEFFGRTGRGLGFLTYFSLLIVMLVVAATFKSNKIEKISFWILLSALFSSIYSIMQFFGFDFADWRTQTNGIIGTIGNPNFQSSFIAIAFFPSLIYLWKKKLKIIFIISMLIFLFTLYICESTQGYVALLSSLFVYLLIMLWFSRKQKLFYLTGISFLAIAIVSVFGMLNKGPLSYYLYKVSVRSRGEMWNTAVTTIRENPWLGVGLDSLGDYSLKYQSEKTAKGIAEYMDNSHNFFLQFSATGGIPLGALYMLLVLFTVIMFFQTLKEMAKFDDRIIGIFVGWVSFQLQSLISPASIPSLLWNFIFTGIIFSKLSIQKDEIHRINHGQKNIDTLRKNKSYLIPFRILSVVLSLGITLPLYNADKFAREANLKKDALMAVAAAQKYPESVVRYNRIGADLYSAGLYDLSLEVGRNAIKFNSSSYQTWILILVNPNATQEERITAKENLIKIDPNNLSIKNYKF
jgi:O-antigen ligase